jgi:hypothetical protein
MLSGKKIAAVTALLGGLAVTGAVAPQTYAAETPNGCTSSSPDSKVCTHKSETVYTTKDGKHVSVQQKQDCSAVSRERVVWPESGLANKGTTKIGPEINCSNNVPPAKGFERPHIEF